MAIKLGSNIASLNSQRRLAEAGNDLSKTFERLSSGQRINRASDDAAGLAIADDLRTKSRIYTQAIRNGNDGISLLNIADSAIDALSSVVVRIRELSEQAANGTYSSKQREALDDEAQQLSKEFTRITQSTSFNGLKIFDGSLGNGVRLQLGIGTTESINASVGGAIGSGGFNPSTVLNAEDNSSRAVSLGDLNGDGILDLVSVGYNDSNYGFVTVRLGSGDGSFGNASSYSMLDYRTVAVKLGDINGDNILDIVSAGYSSYGYGVATVRLGNGNGTFGSTTQYTTEGSASYAIDLADLNGDGKLDLITAGFNSTNGEATIRLGTGNGTFGTAVKYSTDANRSYAVNMGDLNGDGILDLVTTGIDDSDNGFATIRLGTGNGLFGTATYYSTEASYSTALVLADLNNDGRLDLITAGTDDSNNGYATIRLGNGNGTFGSSTQYSTESYLSFGLKLGDLNGDGILDMVTTGIDDSGANGFTTVRLGTGGGTFGSATLYTAESNRSFGVALGDLNGDGVTDLITTGSDDSNNGVTTVRLAATREGLGALQEFSLKTRASSLQSMSMLDKSLQNLAKQRGTIGASQSRINIALNNLGSARENFNAAESRIRDADIAQESANLVRIQILQQAASSVLSQANQAPTLALSLLR